VKEIAQYIDEKMREIDKNQSIKSTAKVAILAALNITEELFQERLYRQKLLDQLDEEAKRLNRELAEVLEE
jgi:cell division protein ZapA